jgi:cytochrome c biogenesis protein CcmG, thiol:disulfide interchange protein DsbE
VRTRAAVVTLVVAGLAALASGCGGDPVTKQYVFHQDHSPIKVDTPQLRKLKATAGVEACPRVDAPVADTPRALPDVTLPCLGGGRSVDLARLRGPLLLNVWAQNCQPCKDESPLLQRTSRAYAGTVQVIGVDFQDTLPDYALHMVGELNVTYPQLADPEGAIRAPLDIQGLPYTFFVTRSGSVAFVHPGALTADSEVQRLIHEHLGVPAPRAGT